MSDNELCIRVIEPRDNNDLIELSRLTPMKGAITVFTERAPEYIRFYNLHGIHGEKIDPAERPTTKKDVWNTLVAEKCGKVVGVMGTSGRTVLFDGVPIRMGYLMDARVHPDYQGQGVVKKIGFTFAANFAMYGLDCIVTYIIRGNKRAIKGVKEGAGETFMGQYAGVFHMYQISMYRPYFVGKLRMERAIAADKPEILQLLKEFYAGYQLSPIFTEEYFDRVMEVSIGYRYEDIRVVRENGKIVALIGLWDQAPVRQIVTIKNSPVIRAGIAIARFLRLFFKAPQPPVEGKPLKSLYIKHIACRHGNEATLKKMLKALTNEVRRAQTHHFIWGSYFQNDPLCNLFNGLTKTEVISEMYWGPWNTGWQIKPTSLEHKPVYADFSLV